MAGRPAPLLLAPSASELSHCTISASIEATALFSCSSSLDRATNAMWWPWRTLYISFSTESIVFRRLSTYSGPVPRDSIKLLREATFSFTACSCAKSTAASSLRERDIFLADSSASGTSALSARMASSAMAAFLCAPLLRAWS